LIEWLVVRVIVTDGEVEIRYAIPTSPAGEATRFCHLRSDYRAPLGEAQGVRGPLQLATRRPPIFMGVLCLAATLDWIKR
jgi:hypothetical protein